MQVILRQKKCQLQIDGKNKFMISISFQVKISAQFLKFELRRIIKLDEAKLKDLIEF